MTTLERNIHHLLTDRAWSGAELGRRMAEATGRPVASAIRKARRIVDGTQSPKLPDVETIARIFGVAPADLAWLDLEEALKDMSPIADLGVPRGCGSPAGRDAVGGTPSGGSRD